MRTVSRWSGCGLGDAVSQVLSGLSRRDEEETEERLEEFDGIPPKSEEQLWRPEPCACGHHYLGWVAVCGLLSTEWGAAGSDGCGWGGVAGPVAAGMLLEFGAS